MVISREIEAVFRVIQHKTDEIIAILVDDDGPSGESNSLKPIMQ